MTVVEGKTNGDDGGGDRERQLVYETKREAALRTVGLSTVAE